MLSAERICLASDFLEKRENSNLTFLMLKPDGVQKQLGSEIEKLLEEAGLKIIARKKIRLTELVIRELYSDICDKDALNACIPFLASGECEGWIVEGPDAINKSKAIIGVTELGERKARGIRGKYAESSIRNVIHKADNIEEAGKHISLVMPEYKPIF